MTLAAVPNPPAPAPGSPEFLLAQMEREILAEEQALADAQKARVEATNSTEARMLAARIKLDAVKREREAAEREAEDERAWLDAQAKYGARCGRVYTGGGWLILRANSAQEWEQAKARAATVVQAALESPGDPTENARRADRDSVLAFQDELLKKSLVHPPIEKARKIVAEYHGVWPELYEMREQLNRGPREAAGKGGAR